MQGPWDFVIVAELCDERRRWERFDLSENPLEVLFVPNSKLRVMAEPVPDPQHGPVGVDPVPHGQFSEGVVNLAAGVAGLEHEHGGVVPEDAGRPSIPTE